MTREEFYRTLEYTDDVLEPGAFSVFAKELLAHDAEQREEIDRQAQAIRNLETDYILIGTQNREQKDEIARLRETLRNIVCAWAFIGGCNAVSGYIEQGRLLLEQSDNAIKETP